MPAGEEEGEGDCRVATANKLHCAQIDSPQKRVRSISWDSKKNKYYWQFAGHVNWSSSTGILSLFCSFGNLKTWHNYDIFYVHSLTWIGSIAVRSRRGCSVACLHLEGIGALLLSVEHGFGEDFAALQINFKKFLSLVPRRVDDVIVNL